MPDPVRSAKERMQHLLEALRPGDEIRVQAASQATGMDASTCENVLEALARVGLFTRTSNRVFVRRRMFDVVDRLHV